ncbi:MAG: hypothetical protein M1517_03520 [Deltaproteobacteria bacterium]|nr:hypothetical protein [Deltaproteobacteria bacterium]
MDVGAACPYAHILWKYGDVMGRTPLYRKELCFTSRGENSFFMITNGRGTYFKIY